MYTFKDTELRNDVPTTPRYPQTQIARTKTTWISFGSAIVLISLIVAIVLGLWILRT